MSRVAIFITQVRGLITHLQLPMNLEVPLKSLSNVQAIWVVLYIRVPFWVPHIVRHPYIKKWTLKGTLI